MDGNVLVALPGARLKRVSMFVAKAGDEMLRYCLSGVDVVERMETCAFNTKGRNATHPASTHFMRKTKDTANLA